MPFGYNKQYKGNANKGVDTYICIQYINTKNFCMWDVFSANTARVATNIY